MTTVLIDRRTHKIINQTGSLEISDKAAKRFVNAIADDFFKELNAEVEAIIKSEMLERAAKNEKAR